MLVVVLPLLVLVVVLPDACALGRTENWIVNPSSCAPKVMQSRSDPGPLSDAVVTVHSDCPPEILRVLLLLLVLLSLPAAALPAPPARRRRRTPW